MSCFLIRKSGLIAHKKKDASPLSGKFPAFRIAQIRDVIVCSGFKINCRIALNFDNNCLNSKRVRT